MMMLAGTEERTDDNAVECAQPQESLRTSLLESIAISTKVLVSNLGPTHTQSTFGGDKVVFAVQIPSPSSITTVSAPKRSTKEFLFEGMEDDGTLALKEVADETRVEIHIATAKEVESPDQLRLFEEFEEKEEQKAFADLINSEISQVIDVYREGVRKPVNLSRLLSDEQKKEFVNYLVEFYSSLRNSPGFSEEKEGLLKSFETTRSHLYFLLALSVFTSAENPDHHISWVFNGLSHIIEIREASYLYLERLVFSLMQKCGYSISF